MRRHRSLLIGQNGSRLIPDDGISAALSARNTALIESQCKIQILELSELASSKIASNQRLGEAIGSRQYPQIVNVVRRASTVTLRGFKGDVMQIQTLKRLTVLSVLVVLTAVSAHAQSGTRLTVNIPFNFYIGGKALNAGQYEVGRAMQPSVDTLVLRPVDGSGGTYVLTRTVQAKEPGESRLVFRRYDDQYFLGEVWLVGSSTGRGLPLSSKERMAAQEIARLGANLQKVSVVGNRR
jgi:hypothetical protein